MSGIALRAMLSRESESSSKKKSAKGLRVNQPGDTFEREADRVADTVSKGGRVLGWSLSATAAGDIQRDPAASDQQAGPKPNNYGDALGKIAEAFMQTSTGKEILKFFTDQPIVKAVTDFVQTPGGIAVAGSAAIGAVSALAATHNSLPAQIPAIPLNIGDTRLKLKISYEGPVNHPTQAMLTVSYEGSAPKKKDGPDEKSRYRAETAAIAADQEKFRAGMTQKGVGPVASAEAQQRQVEDQAIQRAQLRRMGSILQPGAATSQGWQFAPLVPATQPMSLQMRDGQTATRPTTQPDPTQVPADPANKEEIPVQRNAESAYELEPDAAPEVESVLSSAGRALDRETRQTMESRIGFDFSKVRIHTDSSAAASAKSLGARAYTVGSDIVFGLGRYAPNTTEGRRLLAHELTHVVQQGQSVWSTSRIASQSNASGHDFASGPAVAISHAGPVHVARDPDPEATQGVVDPGSIRIVRIDTNVVDQVGRGNVAVANRLRQLSSDPKVKVQMGRGVYIEMTKVKGSLLVARKALIAKFNIEIVDESIADRAEIYQKYAESPNFDTHGGPKITGGEAELHKDLSHIASAAKGGKEVEFWTMDGPARKNAEKLQVKIALPESDIPFDKSPSDYANIYRLLPEIIPADIKGGGGTPTGGSGTPPPPEGGGPPPAGPGSGGTGPAGGGAGMALAPLAEGVTTTPGSRAEIMTRQKLIADFELEASEFGKLSGRLRAYGAIFGGMMQIYTAFSTVTDAISMQADGTLYGDAQRNADALATRSSDDLANIQAATGKISLLSAVASVSDARARGDQEALFDLSSTLGDFGMSATESSDIVAGMSNNIDLRIQGLQVLENFYDKMTKLPVDPMAGTLPQAQAFMQLQSIQKFLGPLMTAGRNYKTAADTLSFYANYTSRLAHEANQSAWTLVLRKLVQSAASASSDPSKSAANNKKATTSATQTATPGDRSHATPPGVHLDATPRGFPTVEEQQGKNPCGTCHPSQEKDHTAGLFKPMTDAELAEMARRFQQ